MPYLEDNLLPRRAVGANGHVYTKGEGQAIGVEPEGREMIITKVNVPTKPELFRPQDWIGSRCQPLAQFTRIANSPT
jgi:hypothetical protein